MTDPTVRAIGDALAGLVPDGVRTGAVAIDAGLVDELWPEELAAVSAAVPSRRSEFATGRRLLRDLTGTTGAIGVGADRAPRWPDGWLGSLAHDPTTVIAAVAPTGTVAALGVDLEPAGHMDDHERAVVLRADDPPIDARAALVLKEAAYKAWSGLGGGLIDFADVRLDADDDDTFRATVLTTGLVLDGRWSDVAGVWLAVVVAR